MADKKHILTYAGLKQYEDELQNLKVVRRKEVAQKIKEAREQGDLSENAEYDAAKDEQRDIELRIEELEKLLKNAEVVVEEEIDVNKINIGCKVKLLDVEYDEEMEFYIVGSTEARSHRQVCRRCCRRRNTGWNYSVQGTGDPESIIVKFKTLSQRSKKTWESSRSQIRQSRI